MPDFGTLVYLDIRDMWLNEARDFTPWLKDNIDKLGEVIGIDLEVIQSEADVGDFSLDLLAKDLGTGQNVIIENQLENTDHDHLGKLLTYAAGFEASVIIWISKSIRDEHRQTLEWLNERTDVATQFFGITIEVFKIDNSRPAFKFVPVVFPNDWQRINKQRSINNLTPRAEEYRIYFQRLIDVLREDYNFTRARIGQPQGWYTFPSGIVGILYGTSFARNNRVRVELFIDFGDIEQNKIFFDSLLNNRQQIETEFGSALSWERLDEKRSSRVALYREGSIDTTTENLSEIQQWSIDNLIKFKRVFSPYISRRNNN